VFLMNNNNAQFDHFIHSLNMAVCNAGFVIPPNLVDDVSLSLVRRVQELEAEVDYLNSNTLTKGSYFVDVNSCDDDGVYHVAKFDVFSADDFIEPRFDCGCDDD
jgi:hypothetical protein